MHISWIYVNNKARKITWAVIEAPLTGKNALEPENEYASAAIRKRLFAGNAGADSVSAKSAWKKISGACPATVLHGNALTVGDKTVLGISKK